MKTFTKVIFQLRAGCGIVNLFTESRKVYGIVSDRHINIELRYSGAGPLRDLKTINASSIIPAT